MEFHGNAIAKQLPRRQFALKTFEFMDAKREEFEGYLQVSMLHASFNCSVRDCLLRQVHGSIGRLDDHRSTNEFGMGKPSANFNKLDFRIPRHWGPENPPASWLKKLMDGVANYEQWRSGYHFLSNPNGFKLLALPQLDCVFRAPRFDRYNWTGPETSLILMRTSSTNTR